MNKLKIAVYAIAKNEQSFVNRFCDSAADADYILIADTGSTDDTVKLASTCATVVSISVTPWRFDTARDAALTLVPSDVDVCIALDLDEVLEPGWREEIETVWIKNQTTRLRYGYDWGNGVVFHAEKIHARTGYKWHHPCHEYPRPDARIQEVWANTDKLLIRHLPDMSKSRGQYLDLLKTAVTEDPTCPRNAFYYARELTFWSKWTEAIAELNRYLSLPSATWPDERAFAQRLLGRSYENVRRHDEARKWFRLSAAEAPHSRESWCDLALNCYNRADWQECYGAAKLAISITDRRKVYMSDPIAWGPLAFDLAGIAAWNLGLKQEAIVNTQKALEFNPNDARLQENLKLMTA